MSKHIFFMKGIHQNAIYLVVVLLLMNSCGNDEGNPMPVDCTINPIIINLVNTTKASCGIADGEIEVAVIGGDGGLLFSRNGGATFQDGGVFSALSSGTYFILVRDANNCENTLTVFLENVGGVTIAIDSKANTTCDTNVGEIVASSTGASGTVQFRLDNGSPQSSGTFNGLAAGKYIVWATDSATGCETAIEATIETGISYANTIKNIITTKCAIAGCHVSGTGRQIFTDFSVVKSNASGIRSRTQSGNMPLTGSLTQDQIDLIACWVGDGALNN